MRITNYIAFSILLFGFFCGHSQKSISLEIQPNKNSYPDKDYFFNEIVDNHYPKEEIGTIYKSNRQSRHTAVLRDPLDKELYQFLAQVFPNAKSENKLIVQIKEFEIGHILAQKDTGYVKLNFNFYLKKNDSLFFISSYAKTLSETADDVFLTHANRMKRAILLAVADMETHLPEKHEGHSFAVLTTKGSQLPQPPANKNTLPVKDTLNNADYYSPKKLTKEDSLDLKYNYPDKFFFLFGLYANFCTGSAIYGANVNFLFQLPKHKRYLVGANLNYSIIKFYDRNGLPLYQSYQLKSSDFGLRMLRQIRNYSFFNVSPHFMLGKETYITHYTSLLYDPGTNTISSQPSTTSRSSFFFGFLIDAGLYFMAPKGPGAFCGFDLTMRFTNSSMLESDVGAKISVGLKF